MMKIVSAQRMRQIDRKAVDNFGIPAIILMENAAIAGAFCVLQMLKGRQDELLIVCGQGNNGGDGLACARHLINHGLKVKVCLAGKQVKMSPETKLNYHILQKLGAKIIKPNLFALKKELRRVKLIVDALLGIGLKDKVKEPLFGLIKLINGSRKPVLALDVPSGLNATTGASCGIAVRAKRTVTFGLIKSGLLNPDAKKYVGELIVANISLPPRLLV